MDASSFGYYNLPDFSNMRSGGVFGDTSGYNPYQGSNQWMSYPSITPMGSSTSTAMNQPGVVPQAPSIAGVPGSQDRPTLKPGQYENTIPGSFQSLPGGKQPYTQPTFDPQFTQQLYEMLSSQLGQGMTPFNLQALLPSSGQATGAGQLSAPLTQLLQQLQQFYGGGASNIPGASQMATMAQTGSPISAMPEWQTMLDAQQRQIEQGGVNLREQFAFGGDLKSSPFGQATTDYYSQTAANQNALLAQMQTAAMENAMNRRMGAGEFMASGAGNIGQLLQGLDQNAISALYQEFQRTQPQNNPLLSMMYGSALGSPNVVQPAQNQSSTLGGIGSILTAIPSILPFL